MQDKFKKIINYLDTKKWPTWLSLAAIVVFILYGSYDMYKFSLKYGYETITLMSIVSFDVACFIFILSAYKKNNIFEILKNILIVVLATISIFAIFKLKLQVDTLENRIENIEKVNEKSSTDPVKNQH